MKINRESYFVRQTTLAEIGVEGQQKLQNASVLVIGCGGLGNPLAIYLATSGVGKLHLVDFDVVSVSNLHRQVFYKTDDIGKSKAEILASEVKKRAPFTQVTFSNNAVDKQSVLALISNFDVIVDATDNLQVKYLINDACVLSKKPLVYGSLYKYDGYVATFNVPDKNGDYSCNLRDAFPEIATDIPNCEQAGTLNPIVGIISLLQVNEVIKLITKTGKLLTNTLLVYNALENSQFKIKLKKNSKLHVEIIFKNTTYLDEGCSTQDPSFLIEADAFKKIMNDDAFRIINVGNSYEIPLPFKVHHQVSLTSFNADDFSPDFTKSYIVVCKKGISSYEVLLQIKEKYPMLSIFSLKEGTAHF